MSSIPSASFIDPGFARASRRPFIDRICKRLTLAALERVRHGSIRLRDGDEQQVFGRSADGALHASIIVHRPRFYRALALGGTLGAGEAYIDGDWSCDDLTALIQIVARNEGAFAGMNRGLARIGAALARGWHALRRNTRTGSRRNIAAHYDLSNAFYALWLDETMMYSSAVFDRATSPSLEDAGPCLRTAQVAKLDRICQKLDLKPADALVEIGAGWGGFALHAAEHYGCYVTTTTISEQQHRLAAERLAAAGVNARVTLLRDDYRDLSGRFDKLVSIEMIEAVGWQYYDTYFSKIAELLKPDGAACIQAITVADRYYEHAKRDVDFIKRYVFPGSCIPALGAIAASVARATDLTITDVEDLTPHYATTLRLWLERFRSRLHEVRALGFGDAFIRMWEYYLQYCEAGFRERTIGLHQIVLTKPGWRGRVARHQGA